MKKIGLEYGCMGENEYLIDRIEDRREVKSFVGGGMKVMVMCGRRWGKCWVVKGGMEEVKEEEKDVRVWYVDGLKILCEEEF